MSASLTIEPADGAETGTCDCCGQTSYRVWGFVYRDGSAHAAYYVHWTQGHVAEHGATWDIVFGAWGDETSAADRFAARLRSRHDESNDLMVIDADPVAMQSIAGTALRRDDIVGQSFAEDIYAICDAVLLQDARVGAMAEESLQK